MRHKWLLTDIDSNVYVDAMEIGPDDVPGVDVQTKFSIRKRRLSGGPCDGVDIVDMDSGAMSCTVVPTRGMGLWRAQVGDIRLGWQSPVRGPVHPKFVNLYEDSGLGWLDGFDELMCRCGLESNGGPVSDEQGRLLYALHGRIANTPAHVVAAAFDAEQNEISLVGQVDETRLFHNKLRLTSTVKMPLGESRLKIVDTVTNLSAEPGELQLLYHTNFGSPMLEAGSKLVAPAKTVIPQTPRSAEGVATWDVYGPPEPGYAEMVNFLELLSDGDGNTEVMLKNAKGDKGVSLLFNTRQLPTFTQWKSTQAIEDGYVTGLEPGVNLPNPRSFEESQGRVVKLSGGESRNFELEIAVHTSAAAVETAEKRIATLRGNVETKIYTSPQPNWSPA